VDGLLFEGARRSGIRQNQNRHFGRIVWKSFGFLNGIHKRGRLRPGERNGSMGANCRFCLFSANSLGWVVLRRRLVDGGAWIDVEIQDNRGQKPVTFTVPIVAERRESNMWGYTSGDRAAKLAWDRVGIQLTRALDAIARTVRDQQP